MLGRSTPGYTQLSGDERVIKNLYQRFSPYGASRETVEAVLRDCHNQAPRAVKRLRERYSEPATPTLLDEGASHQASSHAGRGTEPEPTATAETVRIFSQSAGRHVDAKVVAREAGWVTVSYRVDRAERTKRVREEDVVEVGRTSERLHDGARQHHVTVDGLTGPGNDVFMASSDDDDDDDDADDNAAVGVDEDEDEDEARTSSPLPLISSARLMSPRGLRTMVVSLMHRTLRLMPPNCRSYRSRRFARVAHRSHKNTCGCVLMLRHLLASRLGRSGFLPVPSSSRWLRT